MFVFVGHIGQPEMSNFGAHTTYRCCTLIEPRLTDVNLAGRGPTT